MVGAVDSDPPRFEHTELRDAVFRDVDLSGAKFIDAFMPGVSISGFVGGLTVNGVEVWPLIEAELDRLHPERVTLRPDDADGVRAAVAAVHALWVPTIEFARTLSPPLLDERVDDEWSFLETLRHLVFVADGWFLHAVLGETQPYDRLGLVPPFLDAQKDTLGLPVAVAPRLDEVLAVRAARMVRLASYAASVSDDQLAEPRPDAGAAYPPSSDDTVLQCLRVLFDEEWWHHRYATRDLAVLTGGAVP